jgi:uncharacterized phage protein (TIGR01671 family)
MKEIKFRAWIKPEREMTDVLDISFNDKYIITETEFNVDFETGDSDIQFKLDEIELMQYTGLRDINGIEIFEGDIVSAVEEEKFGGESSVTDVIQNMDGQWQVRTLGKDDVKYSHGLPIAWGGWEKLEVIGNIYENPELLT